MMRTNGWRATTFAPVGQMSTSPFILVGQPSVPVKTLQELIALAKSKPGQLNYSSSGIGAPPHVVEMAHISVK
jgi:tripartite-type tricarboxylate transporter receptor subunit TctC